MGNVKLDPTQGHIIYGTVVDDHRFIGRVPSAQLFQMAPDPRQTEDKKQLSASKEVQDLRRIREEVQRLFEGQKKRNVPAYAKYIVGMHHGEDGLTPVITLYSREPLPLELVEEMPGVAKVQVPWGVNLVAIDGETQLAARFEAAQMDRATEKEMVPIYLCHGKDLGWARQSFHDLNTLAVRPNVALAIGMDARDPITRIVREVERKVPFFRGRVNKVRRQLKRTDADVITIAGLRSSCVTLAKGINGVQYGAKPAPIDEAELGNLEAAAIDWYEALSDALGPTIEDRERTIAGSPTVFAALGAVGHEVVNIADSAARRNRCRQLANELQQVRWERGQHWEGIAGKFTPKGRFSVGGAKETAYAVYAALSDPSSAGYKRVRNGQSSEVA